MNVVISPARHAIPASAACCYHCGSTMPTGVTYRATIDGVEQPMCCRGCEAVAEMIVAAGLTDFYRHRTTPAPRGDQGTSDITDRLDAYEHPGVQKLFVRRLGTDNCEVSLILEKVACPACLWLIERYLRRQPGITEVRINYSTRRARVTHDGSVALRQILETVRRLGYNAQPFDPRRQQQQAERERATLLRRLGVAAVLGMQVMMVAMAFYFDDGHVAAEHRQLLNTLNLLLTTPVVFYSGLTFLQSAWRGLRNGTLNMDVPVSVGILLAYFGSAWATWQDDGRVYYDSVVMFVTLLLTARYLEYIARRRATDTVERFNQQRPLMATRLTADAGAWQEALVPAVELLRGDRVLVRPGEVIPADGTVVSGTSSVDESLLSGESMPVRKQTGASVIGGSLNVESPLQVTVEKVGENTVLAGIVSTLERAQGERPRLTQLADRISGWFVLGVLIAAAATGLHGYSEGNAQWFATTLAVLVITCPCALSLATPVALTCAINALMQRGVLVVNGQAIETLSRTTHVLFDKTGTLTHGKPRLTTTTLLTDMSREECLTAAAALEHFSEHPIAKTVLAAAGSTTVEEAEQVVNHPGQGLEGTWRGKRWFSGAPAFVRERTGLVWQDTANGSSSQRAATTVVLADEERIHCVFGLDDTLRDGVMGVIGDLKNMGKEVMLLTGDNDAAASRVAEVTGITHWRAGLKPEEKLAEVKRLQREGAVVAMVGDGVNDAPVLAGAQVSMAMDSGAALARASADLVLLRGHIDGVPIAMSNARRTLSVVRANLLWAVLYNLAALPAAMAGVVSPAFAAVGMSLSSLLVVANALRLLRIDRA